MPETPKKFRLKPFKAKRGFDTKKSMYSSDGSCFQKIPRVLTVGELKAVLSQMPDSLPLNNMNPLDDPDDDAGYSLHWYNVGDSSENLGIDDCHW